MPPRSALARPLVASSAALSRDCSRSAPRHASRTTAGVRSLASRRAALGPPSLALGAIFGLGGLSALVSAPAARASLFGGNAASSADRRGRRAPLRTRRGPRPRPSPPVPDPSSLSPHPPPSSPGWPPAA